MKIRLLVLVSVTTLVSGDGGGHGSSSYAVLPYGEPQHGGGFGAQEYGGYDHDYDYGYEVKEMFKKPFKAMKGAGDYMMNSFKKGGSKFLELGGSIFRAKGELFKGVGENLLRHAYGMAKGKGKGKKEEYDSPSYYYHSPPVSYGSPIAYGPPPPVYKKPVVDSYGGGHDLGHGHDAGHGHGHDVEHGLDHGIGHSAGLDHGTGFGPSGGLGHEAGHGVVYASDDFGSNTIHKRESVKERSARSHINNNVNKLRRDYGVPAPYPVIKHQRPIPVPVPFPVVPSRLIFPSFPIQKQYKQPSGYH